MINSPKSSKWLFAFDLDATITKCEFLPMLARSVGLDKEIAALTEAAMCGTAPFEQNFRSRVDLLKEIPVSKACAIALQIPLHEKLAEFIRNNPHRCVIVTGNLDVWIDPIIQSLEMQGRCLCSRAVVYEDRLTGIASILDKESVCKTMPHPFIAIGDGRNDVGMLKTADIGIAFGGVHEPPDELLAVSDVVFREENKLVDMLKMLL